MNATHRWKKCLGISALAMTASHAGAADVTLTMPRSAAGEPIVRVETILRQPPEVAWRWFATEAGLRCWAAPVVKLDLRIGGSLLTHYDPKASIGAPGTIALGIVNYVDAEFLTYQVKLTDAFPATVRADDGRLQEVVRFERLPDGGTRIIATMLGWGTGPDWDKTVAFFGRGNEYTYQALVRCAAAAEAPR